MVHHLGYFRSFYTNEYKIKVYMRNLGIDKKSKDEMEAYLSTSEVGEVKCDGVHHIVRVGNDISLAEVVLSNAFLADLFIDVIQKP
jgi:hypothetical protein